MFKSLALGIFIVALGVSLSYSSKDWNTLINISGTTTVITLILSAILSDFPSTSKNKANRAAVSDEHPTENYCRPKQKLAWNLIFVGLPNLMALFVVSFIFEDFLFDPNIIYPMWFQTLFYIGAILMIFHSINIVKYWMEGRGFFQWLREDHGTYIKWMIIFTLIYAASLILINFIFPD
ncbi:MAG: hypothetical protein FH756_15810 [Firmicutes bacterium]|nr:hypothetical protein [Bacillota bacterium]